MSHRTQFSDVLANEPDASLLHAPETCFELHLWYASCACTMIWHRCLCVCKLLASRGPCGSLSRLPLIRIRAWIKPDLTERLNCGFLLWLLCQAWSYDVGDQGWQQPPGWPNAPAFGFRQHLVKHFVADLAAAVVSSGVPAVSAGLHPCCLWLVLTGLALYFGEQTDEP